MYFCINIVNDYNDDNEYIFNYKNKILILLKCIFKMFLIWIKINIIYVMYYEGIG